MWMDAASVLGMQDMRHVVILLQGGLDLCAEAVGDASTCTVIYSSLASTPVTTFALERDSQAHSYSILSIS